MIFHNILGQNLIDFYVASWQDGHILLSNGDVVATWSVPSGAVLVSNPQFEISHREHKVHGTKSV